ncbi:Rhodanese-like protein [Cylindrobasidium torrendii FP15055 ss-10]|uniref:Rhodanese-like protein n=1 Tax=Cylindrobasidium torrendii FP15055 ss-10 TaxID=1314674 RepID=A0A0D7B4M0_9AGAR|nr:Rhodanese-like protein [Cylindrobasidium torrendii FP15055 ss-10]
MPIIRYIEGDDLAAYMKSGKVAGKDYLVVDVRDDDFAGGNIKGAKNVPSSTIYDAVDNLVRDTKDIKRVVFHCALSQVRGPKAARIYAETRQNMLQEAEPNQPEVLILRDGFTQFQVKYKDDADLIEGWDKEVWASDWS